MCYPILWRKLVSKSSCFSWPHVYVHTYIYIPYYHMFSSNSYVQKKSSNACRGANLILPKKKLNTLAPPVPYLHHREHVARWPSVSLAPALWYTSGRRGRNGCSKRQVAKKITTACNLERHDIRTTWMIAPEPRKTKNRALLSMIILVV